MAGSDVVGDPFWSAEPAAARGSLCSEAATGGGYTQSSDIDFFGCQGRERHKTFLGFRPGKPSETAKYALREQVGKLGEVAEVGPLQSLLIRTALSFLNDGRRQASADEQKVCGKPSNETVGISKWLGFDETTVRSSYGFG